MNTLLPFAREFNLLLNAHARENRDHLLVTGRELNFTDALVASSNNDLLLEAVRENQAKVEEWLSVFNQFALPSVLDGTALTSVL